MKINSPEIIFICALMCEAKPLIEHYQLKVVDNGSLFPIYTNDSTALVISGIGSILSASAVAYTHALLSIASECIWLNIGICGHRDKNIGESFLAHRITYEKNRHSFYPPILFDLPCLSAPVKTVLEPEKIYSEDTLYDMEAFGFYQMAAKVSTAELVQCFKIISDNQLQPAAQIYSSAVSHLVHKQVPIIDQMIFGLKKLKDQLPEQNKDNPCEELFKRYHFTHTQKYQLQRLFMRWKALWGDSLFPEELFSKKNTNELLASFEEQINLSPLEF